MNRDSRLKPLVETGTGSIGEADESGGGEANRPRTGAIKPLNTPVEEITSTHLEREGGGNG